MNAPEVVDRLCTEHLSRAKREGRYYGRVYRVDASVAESAALWALFRAASKWQAERGEFGAYLHQWVRTAVLQEAWTYRCVVTDKSDRNTTRQVAMEWQDRDGRVHARDWPDERANPDAALMADDVLRCVDERYKALIRMRAEGWSLSEIGEMWGMTKQGVAGHERAAVKAARAAMEERA